jgi:glyoxylase-like metal-dependent hydrolase (beta-lactamase superfamily II)
LQIVVASHRHADHISGFGRAKAAQIIRDLQPRRIVTLDRGPAVAHRRRAPRTHKQLVTTMGDMQLFAAGATAAAIKMDILQRFPDGIGDRLRFLGERTSPTAGGDLPAGAGRRRSGPLRQIRR